MADLQMPMARLAVETALLANGTNLMNFIGFMIGKVREVKSFQRECQKLVNVAIDLSLSYLEHQQHLRKIQSGKTFLSSLQSLYLFVIQCCDWSILHVGWEVFCAGKVEKLHKEFSECQSTFNTEILINLSSTTTVSAATVATVKENLATFETSFNTFQGEANSQINSLMTMKDDLAAMGQSAKEYQKEINDNKDQRQHFNQNLNDVRREIEDSRAERLSASQSALPAVPVITDPSDQVIWDQPPNMIEPKGLFDGQKAVFHTIGGFFPSRSRITKIYQIIGEMTPPDMMQKVYGILKKDDAEYFIMENCDSYQSLLDCVQQGALRHLSILQKLSFCYDLASLVSILHSLDLVVKSITDVNVRIQNLEGQNSRPKLINLHYIRKRRDPSGREDIDWRFDAPETPKAQTRSKMSDIWSLGIILAEIFTESLPFSIGPCARSEYDKTTMASISSPSSKASHGETGRLMTDQVSSVVPHAQHPFPNLKSALPQAVSELIGSTLASNPMLRPSASKLAQNLLELLLYEASVASSDVTPTLSSTAEIDLPLVERMINEAKKRHDEEGLALMKKLPLPPRNALFDTKQIEGLLESASEHTHESVVLYAVGSAYLWGLCTIAEGEKGSDGRLPSYVLQAEKSLSYLKAASAQGYNAASELYYAHKQLMRFYFEQLERARDF